MPDFFEIKEAYTRLTETEKDLGRMVGYPRSEEHFNIVIRDIVDRLQLGKNDNLVDVGCGNGNVLKNLEPYAGSLTGVDLLENFLKVAKTVLPSVNLITASSSRIPLTDSCFSKVLCYGVFVHFSSEKSAFETIRELCRICRPGGRVLIGDIPVRALRRKVIKLSWEIPYRLRVLLGRHPGPSIFNPLRWRFYDIKKLAEYARSLGHECEIHPLPSVLWVASHREHLLIRVKK
jgi:SAM-dependent methyltransferase